MAVTYANHTITESPSWTINETWLDRVSTVIDQALERGLYVVTNMHHDSWMWADVSAAGANISMIEERFSASWSHIGAKLACKSSMVAFEPINEPRGTTKQHADELNRLNVMFLDAINKAGGWNSKRVVTLVGLGEDSIKTSQWFQMPTNYTNPMAIQYHYYSPYDFIFSAWGKTIWGSDADKASLETDLELIRNNFTDVPLVIGEWSASPGNTEPAARWKYVDFLVRTANKYNTSTILWDNGADNLDRAAHKWRDLTSVELIMNAKNGTSNSLPDSTEDLQATSQFTSAYIWHKVGDPVDDQNLPFLMNGNDIVSVTGPKGTTWVVDDQFYVTSTGNGTGANITFPQKTMLLLVGQNDAPGSKANLTLHFSKGADIVVNVMQWDVPKLSSTSSAVSSSSSSDLAIPIQWNGVKEPAAVKAVESDGTYLFDSWTQYLGPLQQARVTYSSQYNWDGSHIIITAAAVQAVAASGKSTTFTIEGWPRVPGNAVNYTLTV